MEVIQANAQNTTTFADGWQSWIVVAKVPMHVLSVECDCDTSNEALQACERERGRVEDLLETKAKLCRQPTQRVGLVNAVCRRSLRRA